MKILKGKFYGLGVGPGEPELITLKACKILEEVDVLCYPKSAADKDSLALMIVEKLVDKKFEYLELNFPMVTDPELLENSWSEAGEKVAAKLQQGQKVAFVTIGDPMFYSTYGYILKYIAAYYPGFDTMTVPGVTAMSAGASLLGVPLVEADESLVVLPGVYGLESLEESIEKNDNVVIMKVGKQLDAVIELLERLNMKGKAVFVSRCGYRDQLVTTDLYSLRGQVQDYMSLIIIKKKGFGQKILTGGMPI